MKAMEAVKNLERSREGLLGAWGSNVQKGGDGNWGGPPRPGALRVPRERRAL
ncbi:MAG TPA: hypothetical protein VK988_01710 [Acidimicrobiales bacterium]|nr:hypothetical protein [Acidimicrobiales bacterium]